MNNNRPFIIKNNFVLKYSDIKTHIGIENLYLSGEITLEKAISFLSCLESNNSILIEGKEDYKDYFLSNPEKGLLLMTTSGTTGVPKLVAHDKNRFIERVKKSKKRFKTCLFMPWYHIGGLHTLLYIYYSGGTCYIPESYEVSYFLDFVEKNEIEVLAITPSYLNLMLLNPKFPKKLRSVKIITCGSEPFVESNVEILRKKTPWVDIKQKFGSTETGVLESRTCNDNPEWIQPNPDGNWKIKDNMLYIKSDISCKWVIENGVKTITGNYYCTGDYVEIRFDGYIKILGRKSKTINVGGRNVFPQEVRSAILSIDYIKDADVYGSKNRLLGEVIEVDISLNPVKKELYTKKKFIKELTLKLERHKIPFYINVVENIHYNDRHKKRRKNG